jgi:aminopeptidase N
MDMMPVADPDAIHASPTFIKKELAIQIKDDLAAAVSDSKQSLHLI